MLRLFLATTATMFICVMLNGCGDSNYSSDGSDLPEGRQPLPPDGPTGTGDVSTSNTPPPTP
jgi:hypothetical protein